MTAPLTAEDLAELRALVERSRGYHAVSVRITHLSALLDLAERVCPKCWGHAEIDSPYGLEPCTKCDMTGWKNTLEGK